VGSLDWTGQLGSDILTNLKQLRGNMPRFNTMATARTAKNTPPRTIKLIHSPAYRSQTSALIGIVLVEGISFWRNASVIGLVLGLLLCVKEEGGAPAGWIENEAKQARIN
jgi:hypothetical protein